MGGSWTNEINCMIYFKKETGLETKQTNKSIFLLKFRIKSFCSSYFSVVGLFIMSSYPVGWQVVNQTNAYIK